MFLATERDRSSGRLHHKERCRIISARRARSDEREAYHQAIGTDRRRGKTDWDRLRGLTDEEIDAAIKNDPDSDPANFDWSDAVLVMPRRKEAISIRLDEDVLAYFKALGAGYQTRINAVLRHFVEQAREAEIVPHNAKRARRSSPHPS